MSTNNYGSGGCGCGGGGSGSKGIGAGGAIARTGYHARARSAGQPAGGGCGGGCGGDCGCGGGSCGCNPGLLVRPSFFAGQLLTDDDLQALADYVVNRQRMHNRFLVGSGVACGLAVTCHPCGGGRVIVQPGYAVDCCGNEIAVPCAVELDINAMVRALKVSMHGQDCGDPCAEPVKDRSKQSRGAADAAGRPGALSVPADEQAGMRGRRFCLYINYCEEPSDLVAPYSQDDSCAVTCQPSRLREGFTFELRCPADEPAPPSFADRLQCCIGDLRETDSKAAAIERSQAYARRNQLGVAAYRMEKAPQFDADDAALIAGAKATLGTAANEFIKAGAAAKDQAADVAFLQQQVLRTALDKVHAVGAATARFNMLPADERGKMLAQHSGLGDALAANREAIGKAAALLDDQAGKLLASPFERTLARSIVADTLKYSNPDLAESERTSQQAYVYAYDGVSTPAANKLAHQSLADLKAWLLRKIDQCPPTGQCCLEAEIMAIQVPSGEETTEDTSRAAEKLVRALLRYLLDCICAALLPPCPSCDDPAVKLACLQVDDCLVCEICNLERTFLLTEHNLRYWMPLLHTLGARLEHVCCDVAGRFGKPVPAPVHDRDDLASQHQLLKKQNAFFKSGSQLGEPSAFGAVFPNLVRLTGFDLDDMRSALNIGGNVARVTARDPVITSMAARFTDADALRLDSRNALAAAFASSPASELVRTEVDRAAEVMREKVAAQLRDAATEFDKRASPDTLARAKAVTDLKKEVLAQREANDKLTKRLDALEKRIAP